MQRLRTAGLRVMFVSNTTKESVGSLLGSRAALKATTAEWGLVSEPGPKISPVTPPFTCSTFLGAIFFVFLQSSFFFLKVRTAFRVKLSRSGLQVCLGLISRLPPAFFTGRP